MIGQHALKEKSEIRHAIKSALEEIDRTDDPYNFGMVLDKESEMAIVYFDLPRISPLQFNVRVTSTIDDRQLVEAIKESIRTRLED